MSLIKSLSAVCVITLLAACASTYKAKVNFDKNEQIDTSQYKTFTWLNKDKALAAPVGFNLVMKVRIDTAIEEAFMAKGYKMVEDDSNADFAISYTVGSRDKIRIEHLPPTYRVGFGWGNRYFSTYQLSSETHVRNYSEGKLAIDVFDVATKQPAWHGWAVKRISNAEQNDPSATIRSVVEEVVNQF